jgi:hypothetical protein
MRSKTLIAAAVAGALSIPVGISASYANDQSTGVTGSVTSMSGPVQTQAGDLTFSQAQRVASSPVSTALSDSAPDSVTWYYPDGSVVHQQGLAFHSGEPLMESEPTQVSWYYPDGSVFHQSGDEFVAEIPAGSIEIVPVELASIDTSSDDGGSQTWYYPDGTVMHQETVAMMQSDEPSASTGSAGMGDDSMSNFPSSSYPGDGGQYLILEDAGSAPVEGWTITDSAPEFLIITE